ncbi:MAG: dynamin family protein [Anaerolineaceae bacterium]|nr:dynamin family protein [Anaerolineaceae bacterium]MDE0329945.1 dynamin family protein [Anaerolineaceae bacterium]
MQGDRDRLLAQYDTLRRRQSAVIASLLEFLPRLDGLPATVIEQLRDALLHADHPFLIVLLGPFGAGKSSIINAVTGRKDLMPVGVTPTTDHISILRYGDQEETLENDAGVTSVFYPAPLLQKVSLVDTPGLESVFRGHEDITRNFLHRADIVFLVMLATQALTAQNLKYLQQLKRYGTRVIVLVNQIDLLTEDELRTVLEFVREECRVEMESEPEIWTISARSGLEAWRAGALDEQAWRASGMQRIVDYVDGQLGDEELLRQKLRTSLQITRNALREAEEILKSNQASTLHCGNIAANIEEQLLAQRRDQEAAIERIAVNVSDFMVDAGERVNVALRRLYAAGRAPDLLRRGFLELIGLGGLTRRGGRTYVERQFADQRLLSPMSELTAISDLAGPRLEGQDIQDLDDLVGYARRELESLPPGIQQKMIGDLALPQNYDRRVLDDLPARLDALVREANWPDVEVLDRHLRNTGLYLVVFEVLLLVAAIFLAQVLKAEPEILALLLLTPVIALVGLLFLPLRGQAVAATQDARLLILREHYIDLLREVTRQQLERSMQFRRDAVAPLLRLVRAQTQLHQTQRARLQDATRELDSIEADLPSLGAEGLLRKARQVVGREDGSP